jgi:hypothetical protein
MAKKSRDEIDHYTLDQYEQEKHLGIGHERTKNLGHDWRESEIEKNPAGRVVDYASDKAGEGMLRQPRSQGVYGKFRDPQDGTSRQENHDRWADYAKSNSYIGHGNKAGPGQPPSMPDPRGSHSNKSDGYLLKPKGGFDAGADTGEGRIEKARKY